MALSSSRLTYTRLFSTPDTETHFEQISVVLDQMDVAPPASPAYAGGSRSVSSVFFVGLAARWGEQDLSNSFYHPAPAAQFVTVLSGTICVTTTDGETRRLEPGDVIWIEDVAPSKGHITVVGDRPCTLMFVR
jgi:hypothetical protein